MRKLQKPTGQTAGAVTSRFRRKESRHETLFEAFSRKYPKYAENFSTRFEIATELQFTWDNMIPANIDKFVEYLYECGLSPNSVNQYCKKLKAVLSLYSTFHSIDPTFKKILSTPTDDCFFVYINDDEVFQLLDYLEILKVTPSKTNRFGKTYAVDHVSRQTAILKQFLVGLFTGARHSDYINFSWKNIREGSGTDGTRLYVLTYTSQKTGIKADIPIPIDSPIIPIIQDMPRENYTTVVFNKELKTICHDAGLTRKVMYHVKGADFEGELWEAVTSHTARRSFASNYLSDGADIIDVMHFMGHTNTQQTIGYNQSGPKFDTRVILNRSRRLSEQTRLEE